MKCYVVLSTEARKHVAMAMATQNDYRKVFSRMPHLDNALELDQNVF